MVFFTGNITNEPSSALAIGLFVFVVLLFVVKYTVTAQKIMNIKSCCQGNVLGLVDVVAASFFCSKTWVASCFIVCADVCSGFVVGFCSVLCFVL